MKKLVFAALLAGVGLSLASGGCASNEDDVVEEDEGDDGYGDGDDDGDDESDGDGAGDGEGDSDPTNGECVPGAAMAGEFCGSDTDCASCMCVVGPLGPPARCL